MRKAAMEGGRKGGTDGVREGNEGSRIREGARES